MIPLEINGITQEVPTIYELTTKQYVDLMKLPKFNLIDYITTVLELPKVDVEKCRVKNPLFLSSQLYPSIPDYSKVKAKKHIRGVQINPDVTLGQRFLIEENGKGLKDFDLIVHALEVLTELNIKNMPASETLPEGFFLCRNLLRGNNKGLNFLKRILNMILIRKLKSRRALKH